MRAQHGECHCCSAEAVETRQSKAKKHFRHSLAPLARRSISMSAASANLSATSFFQACLTRCDVSESSISFLHSVLLAVRSTPHPKHPFQDSHVYVCKVQSAIGSPTPVGTHLSLLRSSTKLHSTRTNLVYRVYQTLPACGWVGLCQTSPACINGVGLGQ